MTTSHDDWTTIDWSSLTAADGPELVERIGYPWFTPRDVPVPSPPVQIAVARHLWSKLRNGRPSMVDRSIFHHDVERYFSWLAEVHGWHA